MHTIWLYHVESSSWESLTLQQYKDFRAGKMPKPEAPPEPVKTGYSASEPQRSSDKPKQGEAGSSEAKTKEQSKNKRGDSSSRRSGKKRGAKVEGRVENRGENQEQAKPTTEEKGRSNSRKKSRKGGGRRAKGERPKGEGAPKAAATANVGNPEGKGDGA